MNLAKSKINILTCFHNNHEDDNEEKKENAIYRKLQDSTEKEALIKHFETARDKFSSFSLLDDKIIVHTSKIDNISESNTLKAFNPQWRELRIINLIPDSINVNSFIVLKIMQEPCFTPSMNLMTEDLNGDVINVLIYNANEAFNFQLMSQATSIFSIGKFIVILQPYSKYYSDERFGIRIDNPKGMIKIFSDKEEIDMFIKGGKEPSTCSLFEECKLKGNQSMNKKHFDEAILYYHEGLKYDPNNVIINSNISQAYLKRKYYAKAYEFAEIALKEDQNHIKSHYRKCRALIGMKRYEEAYTIATSKYLKDYLEIDNILEEIKNKMENVKGIYNLNELFLKEKSDFYLDCGDYINPKTTKAYQEDKGIKIIATTFIAKGELISVTKAIGAYSLIDTFDESKLFCDLLNDLTETVMKNKEEYSELFKCHNGNNLSQKYEERGLNIEAITKEDMMKLIQSNMKLSLRTIVMKNKIARGLWIEPSFFNHSCIPNCFTFGIGDVFFIIAQNDIEKNEELTINYYPVLNCSANRRKILQENWKFDCNCGLCTYESQQSELKKRLDNYIKVSLEGNTNNSFYEEMILFLTDNSARFTSYENSLAYFSLAKSLNNTSLKTNLNYFEIALHYTKDRMPSMERLILFKIMMLKKFLSVESKDTEQQLRKNIFKYIALDVTFCENIIFIPDKFNDMNYFLSS